MWKDTFTPENVARGHDGMREGYERFLTANFPIAQEIAVEKLELRGVPALRARAKQTNSSRQPTILHFHGGGYVLGSATSSLEYANRLAQAVGGSCITVDYRLAPEHPYPAAVDDAVDAFRGLIDQGVPASSIVLSGGSSGGRLALALALDLKTARGSRPPSTIRVCPIAEINLP